MIISRKNKFIFLRVSKTGSTTAHNMIYNSGILGVEDVISWSRGMPEGTKNDINKHFAVDDLISVGLICKESVKDYSYIITVRHPVERFLSSYFYKSKFTGSATTLEHFKKLIRSKVDLPSYMGRKQSDYFYDGSEKLQNVTAIDLSNINKGLDFVIKKYGGVTKHVHLNKQDKPDWYKKGVDAEDMHILDVSFAEEILEYNTVRGLI